MEKLGIGGNGRHFVRGERPFFWLGDTAWRLFAALDNEQSRVYLQNRADKGFNAVLAVLLSRVTYHAAENSRVEILYGDMQEFISAENEPYWAHVENVVAMGREAGLYMALLPVWGSFAKEGFINIDNAADYMDFLCKRFNKYENIIWLLGGDIRGDKNADMWDICGARLRENMPDGLIGFHPFGRTSSSYWFHNRDWLDFNMFQSGHRRYDQRNLSEWDEGAAGEPWHGEDNWRYVCADLGKSPQKPTLDGEPSYEQIPQGLHDGSQPFWQDFHIRRYGWWAALAGAAGHVYGHNAVMQMYGTGTAAAYSVADAWDVALHHAGAGQMGILRDIMEEIDFANCRPMQEIFGNGAGDGHEYICALGNCENIVVYNYSGRDFCVNLPFFADGWWLDPAGGGRSYFGRIAPGEAVLTPPVKKTGHNDWVLILGRVDIMGSYGFSRRFFANREADDDAYPKVR